MIVTMKMHKYINELLKNQNITNNELIHNLYSRKEYLELLKPVLELIKSNPYASYTTLKNKLLARSILKKTIIDFVKETELTPGLVLNFGTEKMREFLVYGRSQEYELIGNKKVFNPVNMESNTIFDLASTSKLFTAISITKLAEEKRLDLYDTITSIVPEFKNLDDVTVLDLLKFKVNIKTCRRVDEAKTKEEAESILFTAYKNNQDVYNSYTDIGAMVLRYVVEKITKMSFNDYVKETIFKPLGMNETFLNVPEELIKKGRVASENFSTIIDKDGNPLTKTDTTPGIVQDAKALAIGKNEGIAPGHAGYFSTTSDMITLGQALINNKILNHDSVLSLSENIVGTALDDGYSWFYGSLVFSKQPVIDGKLNVDHRLSGKTFMSPGFAGTTLYVDPLNNICLFIGANRLHNRIWQIHENQKENIITNPTTHKQIFKFKDGTEQVISIRFAGEKEKIINQALTLSLQLQLLERLFPNQKEIKLVRELN